MSQGAGQNFRPQQATTPNTSAASPGGKGAGQPVAPGSKGAGAPTQGQMTPGGKGAGQPMPGGKGQPNGQPMPGNKGQASPATAITPMSSIPGGKAGMKGVPPSVNSQTAYNTFGATKGMPQAVQKAITTPMQQQSPQGMPGGKGQPTGQPMPTIPQGAGQSMPGGKGAGQPDLKMMPPQGMSGGKGAGQAAPGSKGQPQGQMPPWMQQSQQGQQNQQGQDQQHGQIQQPFHNASTNDYNVQGGARMNTPYAAPGTNGGPAAFGMAPGQAGFGFGNGATRVPDTDHLTAGQFNPAIHPQMQQQPQPTTQAAQNQAFRGLPMYQQGRQ